MITTGFVSWLWGFARPILDHIPAIQINYDGITASILTYLQAALYFIPLHTVTSILTIILGLWVLRVVIAFLHTLWSSLPIF